MLIFDHIEPRRSLYTPISESIILPNRKNVNTFFERVAKKYANGGGKVMYSYHNRIKQRIKNGELIGIEKGVGEFELVFIFCTPPFTRPIRRSSIWRYEKILNDPDVLHHKDKD